MPKKNAFSRKGWQIILRNISNFRKEIIFLAIIGLLMSIGNGVIPYVLGKFFDSLISRQVLFTNTNYQISNWLFFLVLFIIIQLSIDVLDWTYSRKNAFLGTRLFSKYQAESSSYILKLPLSFHKNEKIGEVNDKINRAGSYITQITQNVILGLTPQFISLIIGIFITFSISVLLASILIISSLIYILTIFRTIKILNKLTLISHEAWARAYGNLYDIINNIFTVKRFNSEEHERKRIENMFLEDAAKKAYNLSLASSNINFFQKILVTSTRIIIFTLSVYLIANNSITLGELIAINGYAMMVFGPFISLGYNWQTLQNGIVTIEEADKILGKPTEKYVPDDKIFMQEMIGDIEFRNVTFYYPNSKNPVLKNLNFKINAGETVALVGESGAGKSTIIELLMGFYFPQKGKILFDDIDIKKIDLNFLRKKIGHVPQEVGLFNDDLYTNLRYGNFFAKRNEVEKAAKDAYALTFIDKLPKKYNQHVGEKGVKLSIGQKQRIAIARAILRDPKILILDEPTSSLDTRTENSIIKSFDKLMENKTTIIVAHRLSTVRKASRIYVLKEGEIVEVGSHEELIKVKNGVYKELHDLYSSSNN